MLYLESVELAHKDSIEFPTLSEEQISHYNSYSEILFECNTEWNNLSCALLEESIIVDRNLLSESETILLEGIKDKLNSIAEWMKAQWAKFKAWIDKIVKSIKDKMNGDIQYIKKNEETIKKNISNSADITVDPMPLWNTEIVDVAKLIKVEAIDSVYLEMYNEILGLLDRQEAIDVDSIKSKYENKLTKSAIYTELLGQTFSDSNTAKEVNDFIYEQFMTNETSRERKISEFDVVKIMDVFTNSGEMIKSYESASDKNSKILKKRIKNVEILEKKYPSNIENGGKNASELGQLVGLLLTYTKDLMLTVNSTFNTCITTINKRHDGYKIILNKVASYTGS